MGILGIDHVAFRTREPERLSGFYADLLGAERLDGEHHVLRVGGTTLAFFPGEAVWGEDELAFDADREGYERALAAARRLGVVDGEPVSHTLSSIGFVVRDPDGRRIEVIHNDEGVWWR